MVNGSRVRIPAAARHVVTTGASVTKQYNLVPSVDSDGLQLRR